MFWPTKRRKVAKKDDDDDDDDDENRDLYIHIPVASPLVKIFFSSNGF